MNSPRRKRLQEVYDIIENARELLKEINEEEQEYIDNMPENLQGSERYERSEEIVGELEDAISNLEEAMESVEDAFN